MKKTFIFLSLGTLFLTSGVSAEESTEQITLPEFYLTVVRTVDNQPSDLQTTKVSRSAIDQKLCWVGKGDFPEKVEVTEILTSPEKISVEVEEGISKTSNNGKTHTLTSTVNSIKDQKAVTRCWTFEQNDPKGKYTIQVKAHNIQYKEAVFEVSD
ncbi:hypothetical protein [Rodentibacter caecimuris]|uniref:Uncharacterized protein n=1 Tax=Rodentibacter caecimuris TaxID=1796644 RepID=A0ABX3KY83_9PAST|nr:hypothetical protein BKG89_03620 [Rodentibacter heylii]